MTRPTPIRLALVATCAGLLLPAPASAGWVVPGRGYGDGVGMSQYGAYGLAQEGRTYRQIMRHYFTGIELERVENQRIRVLLTSGVGSIPFSGAKQACGKQIHASRTYAFGLSASGVELRRAGGSRIKGCGQEGAAAGGDSVLWKENGRYRGKLVGRDVGGSLYVINDVALESYIGGVIPGEMSTSWPAEALRAQAVAARSYGLATRIAGNGYDLYDDTRSQVYGGMRVETQATDNAIDATRREVITAGDRVAEAFFFSTSGGQTENSEFVYMEPRSYLKSVNDPFDGISPFHRWQVRFTNAEMESRLGPYFAGRLQKIKILQTGISPRIVRARVVGSSDSSVVSGNSLRYALGLRSTWARFVKR